VGFKVGDYIISKNRVKNYNKIILEVSEMDYKVKHNVSQSNFMGGVITTYDKDYIDSNYDLDEDQIINEKLEKICGM
jgi:hypothetical protein